ncbi:MAG: hypothetical protein RJB15_159 [Pseudomonadota bacterium]|jgi:flavin reductase (DIM6/NTAB) family NADH-FMN oxidoreductase RutF
MNNSNKNIDEFKLAMRRFASAISIITSVDENGTRYGMAATSVTSLTVDPPSVLTCINRTASIHAHLTPGIYTCINLLTNEHKELVSAFSGALKGEERFQIGKWENNDKGLPYLTDAQAYMICKVKNIIPQGSHSIIINDVISSKSLVEVNPLIYADGKIFSISELNA